MYFNVPGYYYLASYMVKIPLIVLMRKTARLFLRLSPLFVHALTDSQNARPLQLVPPDPEGGCRGQVRRA
jgi:hypothetical protein